MEPILETPESFPPFESYEAHKEASRQKKDSAAPATDTQPKHDKPVPASDKAVKPAPSDSSESDAPPPEKSDARKQSAPKSETAGDPDTPKKDTQQEKKPRDRTAAGRARELMAEGRVDEAEKILRDAGRADRDKFEASAKAEKERADKLDKELQELRTRKPAAEESPEPKPPAAKAEKSKPEPKSEPAAGAFSEAKPKLEAYIAAASAENPELSYEQLQDKYWEEVDAWTDRRNEWREADRVKQAAAKAEAAKTDSEQAVRKARHDEQMAAARLKYPSFEAELKAVVAAHPTIANDGIGAAFGVVPDTAEVLYAMTRNNGAEYLRIAKLSPQQAYYETVRLAIALEQDSPPKESLPASEPANAEKPKPAVTRAPRPYVPVSGSETPAAATPQSYRDFKNRSR